MATGCIPIVMVDDVRQPGDDLLPYSDFSLRISSDEADSLVRALPASVRSLSVLCPPQPASIRLRPPLLARLCQRLRSVKTLHAV